MAQDKKGLALGGGMVKTYGRYVGQVLDVYVEREVSKAEHMTNVGIEYTRDFVLPIMSGVNVGWVFQEIVPFNANFMLGQPGYRMVPTDRKLANPAVAPGTFGDFGLTYDEYPTLGISLEGIPMWSPLTHNMYNPNPSAPAPAASVVAKNDEVPSAIAGYWGFTCTVSDPTDTHESSFCNIHVVPNYGATDVFTVRVNLASTHVATEIVKVYYYAYNYNTSQRAYYGTYAANGLADLDGIGGVNTVLAGGDITAGYVDISVDTANARVAGAPPSPVVKVSDAIQSTDYQWLDDFDFDPTYRTGSQIRKSANPASAISDWETVYVQYYYNANDVVETPFVQTDGSNPVIPITVIYPFPDNQSKMIFEIPRVQIKTNFRIAVNERDWMGIPFSGMALDASDIYPDYPYGWIQFTGPIATRVREYGNIPWGIGEVGYDLTDQKTSYS